MGFESTLFIYTSFWSDEYFWGLVNVYFRHLSVLMPLWHLGIPKTNDQIWGIPVFKETLKSRDRVFLTLMWFICTCSCLIPIANGVSYFGQMKLSAIFLSRRNPIVKGYGLAYFIILGLGAMALFEGIVIFCLGPKFFRLEVRFWGEFSLEKGSFFKVGEISWFFFF